ncbi:MAG: hypothetical protein JNJ65_03425 [Cyclobacteriaceae bacterium]|nr:hypothetical protein [Cyclobacteriaceae bacterium]
MKSLITKILFLVYGLSISGYVLLDGGHEILHILKGSVHQHGTNHNHHHHWEDHEDIFAPDEGSDHARGTVEISCFFLFYQAPQSYSFDARVSSTHPLTAAKIEPQTQTPRTPPPLV